MRDEKGKYVECPSPPHRTGLKSYVEGYYSVFDGIGTDKKVADLLNRRLTK
jgi:hypothetical protein